MAARHLAGAPMARAPPGATGARLATDAATPEILLQVQDVAIRFGGVEALAGVSLSVGHREIRGVIGPNGSGKTTLFNCIGGIDRHGVISCSTGRGSSGYPGIVWPDLASAAPFRIWHYSARSRSGKTF